VVLEVDIYFYLLLRFLQNPYIAARLLLNRANQSFVLMYIMTRWSWQMHMVPYVFQLFFLPIFCWLCCILVHILQCGDSPHTVAYNIEFVAAIVEQVCQIYFLSKAQRAKSSSPVRKMAKMGEAFFSILTIITKSYEHILSNLLNGNVPQSQLTVVAQQKNKYMMKDHKRTNNFPCVAINQDIYHHLSVLKRSTTISTKLTNTCTA